MDERFMGLQDKELLREHMHALYVSAGVPVERAAVIADMAVHAVEQARARLWEVCDLAPNDAIGVPVSTGATQLLISVLQRDMEVMLAVAVDMGMTVKPAHVQEAGQ